MSELELLYGPAKFALRRQVLKTARQNSGVALSQIEQIKKTTKFESPTIGTATENLDCLACRFRSFIQVVLLYPLDGWAINAPLS